MDRGKHKFYIPQCDGNGYDQDEDYEVTEESDSSVSLESESDFSDENLNKEDFSNKTKSKKTLKEIWTKRVTRLQSNTNVAKLDRRRQPKRGKASRRRSLCNVVNKKFEENSNEGETKFQCTKCHKGFATKMSLGRHLYWCNSLRITRSRAEDGSKKIRNIAQQTKSSKSARPSKLSKGRKSLLENASSTFRMKTTFEDSLLQTQTNVSNFSEIKTNPIHRKQRRASLKFQIESTDESDYETKLASTRQFMYESKNMQIERSGSVRLDLENEPSLCPKCKMTYRNQASLQKHLFSCNSSSSCFSEDEEDNEPVLDENPIASSSLSKFEDSAVKFVSPLEVSGESGMLHTTQECHGMISSRNEILSSSSNSSNLTTPITTANITNTVDSTIGNPFEIQSVKSTNCQQDTASLLAPQIFSMTHSQTTLPEHQNIFSCQRLPNLSRTVQIRSENVAQFTISDSDNLCSATPPSNPDALITSSINNASPFPLEHNKVQIDTLDFNKATNLSSSETLNTSSGPTKLILSKKQEPDQNNFNEIGEQRHSVENMRSYTNSLTQIQQQSDRYNLPTLSMMQPNNSSNMSNIPWLGNSCITSTTTGQSAENLGAINMTNQQLRPSSFNQLQHHPQNNLISFQGGQMHKIPMPIQMQPHCSFSSNQLQGAGLSVCNPYVPQNQPLPHYGQFRILEQQLQLEPLEALQKQQTDEFNFTYRPLSQLQQPNSNEQVQLPQQQLQLTQQQLQMLEQPAPQKLQKFLFNPSNYNVGSFSQGHQLETTQLQYYQQQSSTAQDKLESQTYQFLPLDHSSESVVKPQSSAEIQVSQQLSLQDYEGQQSQIQISNQKSTELQPQKDIPVQQAVQNTFCQLYNATPDLQQHQITAHNPQVLQQLPYVNSVSTMEQIEKVSPTNFQNIMYSPRSINHPYQIMQLPDGSYIIVQPEGHGSSNNNPSVSNCRSQQANEGVFHSQRLTNGMEVLNSTTLPFGILASSNNLQEISPSSNIAQGSFFGAIDLNGPCTSNLSHSQHCLCPRCCLRVATSTLVTDKYRKVLPSPRPIEPKFPLVNTEPKLEKVVPSFVKTYMKRTINKTVKTQLASLIMEKHGTSIPTSISSTSAVQAKGSESLTTFNSQPLSSSQGSRKTPVLTAVVRPMEHPLQKMSDQISQIESSFNASIVPTIRPLTPLSTINPFTSNNNIQAEISGKEWSENLISMPSDSSKFTLISSPALEMINTLDRGGVERTVWNKFSVDDDCITKTSPTTPGGAKLFSANPNAGSTAKSIKLTLKRKEGGNSYSIKDISESEGISSGKMKSLKINAKIRSGEFAGTSTYDVEVFPRIHILPIPDADELDSNLTIVENESPVCNSASVVKSCPFQNQLSEQSSKPSKLTHRVVVVYEVKKHNSTILFQSSDVRAVWSHIFETAQGTKLEHNLPPLLYPATNISLENEQEPTTTFNILGLTHRAIQFLLQHLRAEKKKFRFDEPSVIANDNEKVTCARIEGFTGRKTFDIFGWLSSKHRKPLERVPTPEETSKTNSMPVALQIRNLKEKTEKLLTVMWSTIHGRGLYTRRAFKKNDMIIEYSGEVIRSPVCDQREKYYETKGIGCYMFRINDEYVIDATMKGNAARFINHSCDPNCESKSIKILGSEHIFIYALRAITSGEELTYDYKFEKEDDKHKILCTCSSKKCKKYLN